MPSPTANVLNDAFLNDARARMVDSQIRPNKVTDPGILEAMRQLPRERFLPASLAARAYSDQNVNLGGGRVLLQPMVLARLVSATEAATGEKVLVTGAGTGYTAALFAALGCTVTALEEPGPLFHLALQVLSTVAPSVTLVSGSLPAGWPAGAPYDIILLDGAVPDVPAGLVGQLARDSGRLVTILGPGGTGVGSNSEVTGGKIGGMHHAGHTGVAVHVEPTAAGFSIHTLFDCLCPILPAFAVAPAFQF